jgi:hypothetical protein
MKRDITIKPFRTASGKIDFHMFEGNSTHPTDTLVFDKTKDGMKKSDVYDIDFTLENAADTNLAFLNDPNNKNECMWVAKGSKTAPPACPPGQMTHGEFNVTAVSDLSLTVENQDLNECKYKFVLCFVDKDDGNKVVRYDPIYDNKNGGLQSGVTSLNAGTVLLLGVAAIAVVALIYLSTQ